MKENVAQQPLILTGTQDGLNKELVAVGTNWIYVDPVWCGDAQNGWVLVGWEVDIHRPRGPEPQREVRDLIGRGVTIEDAIRTALGTLT